MKQSSQKFIVTLLLATVMMLWYYPKSLEGYDLDLTHIKLAGSKEEAYYIAGDKFLIAGFDIMDRYWSEIAKTGKHLLRGHLDNYLPIALKSLDYQPADAMMGSFAESFFSTRNPHTGLIPFSYDSLDPFSNMSTGNKQPVALISKGVEICQWFPDDLNLLKKCVALAEATIKHFDENNAGMWGWVEVKDGQPKSKVTLTQDYGAVANGLAYLSQKTGNPKFIKWANQKLEFVWQNRMNQHLALLEEQFTPTQAFLRSEERSSDTDTLYYVRQLFDLHQLTGEKKYLDRAMAVTNLWYDKAWVEQWGHFIRKLNPDGKPAVNQLYGDGKYNTLYILVQAYRTTKDPKYIQRFRQAWDNLLNMGKDGFVPEYIEQGKMVNRYGLDQQQTIFLDILVAAYEASGDKEILEAAENLGNRILQRGEKVMRMEGGQAGQAFLRLALARQKISRLQVAVGKAGTPMKVTQNGNRVLEVIVPAEVAVVYLPEGMYNLEVGKHGFSRKKNIRLGGNNNEKFSIVSCDLSK